MPVALRGVRGLITGLVFVFGFTALLSATFLISRQVFAQAAPTLGISASFAVLASSTVTNTGPSVVNGDLGVAPGNAITGFPPGMVTPPYTIHAADAVALQAQNDVTTAYNTLASEPCSQNLTGQDLAGMTLTTGVYCFDTEAQLTGMLTLDAAGSADALFIFKMGSTLTTASGSSVLVINGGTDCNVWWQVGSSATLGTTTSFVGNILALASISLTTGANVSGRAFAQTGAVTMDTNNIGTSACITAPPAPSATASPTMTASSTSVPPGATAVPTDIPATAPPGATSIPPGATAVPTDIPATAPPSADGVSPVSGVLPGGATAVSGLPNTGGGPPQATYWTVEPRRR